MTGELPSPKKRKPRKVTPAKCRYCRATREEKWLVPMVRRGNGNKVVVVCPGCLERNRGPQNLVELTPEHYLRYCRQLGIRTPEEMEAEIIKHQQPQQKPSWGERTDRIRSVVPGGLVERNKRK